MKKTNNKGFSLVELIVVIAIMGVLMVVLAPQYLKFVEKSRLQKDNSAIAEIANTMKTAMADDTIATAVQNTGGLVKLQTAANAGNKKFDFTQLNGTNNIPQALSDELTAVLGDSFETTSTTYSKAGAITLVIEYDTGTGTYLIKGDNIIGNQKDTTGSSRTF